MTTRSYLTSSWSSQHQSQPQSHSPPPTTSSDRDHVGRFVQDLNNRACVLIAMGNFAKANHLLGLALEKHRDIMGVSSPLLPVGCTEPITPAFDCRRRTPGAEDTDCRDRTSLYEVSSYDSDDLDYDTDEMSLSLSDDEYECDDDCGCLSMEGESFSQDFPPQNPPHNSHHQQQQHGVTHNTPSNSPAIDESPSSASGYGIPRMTTFSQVHTVPYCGQQERIASLRQQEQDPHGHQGILRSAWMPPGL